MAAIGWQEWEGQGAARADRAGCGRAVEFATAGRPQALGTDEAPTKLNGGCARARLCDRLCNRKSKTAPYCELVRQVFIVLFRSPQRSVDQCFVVTDPTP
jgi:hypothetical protein